MHALDFRLLGSWTSVSSMQRDAASRNHLEDYHYGCPEAPHIEAYLWQRIIRLSAELNARRVVDIGCGKGALLPRTCQPETRSGGLRAER